VPFLQLALQPFSLVPLVVGDAAPEEVAQAIDALWGGAETLIVISSDLSHYLPYAEARTLDAATAKEILALGRLGHGEACGAAPVNGLLLSARRRRMRVELVDLRNSGDTRGDKDRVVGYSAFTFYEATA
jgi:AmmeMemoRadiSam system protein B